MVQRNIAMTVDETEMVYECRACGRTKDTKKKLVQHINSKTDSKHRGRSTDDLVMRVYPGVLPSDPSKNNYERIVEAFKRIKSGNVDGLGPDIRNDEIDKVAELSDEPKDKVIRILQDEGIEYTRHGRPASVHFDDLSEEGKTVLAWYHRNPDLSTRELSQRAGYESNTSASDLIRKKSWMLEPRFLEDDVEEYLEDNIDTETILESAKEQGVIQSEDEDGGEEEGGVAEEMVDKGDQSEADKEDEVEEVREKVLDDDNNSDGPLLTLDNPDDVFDYIHSLVVSGKRDKARDIFKELVETEKN